MQFAIVNSNNVSGASGMEELDCSADPADSYSCQTKRFTSPGQRVLKGSLLDRSESVANIHSTSEASESFH